MFVFCLEDTRKVTTFASENRNKGNGRTNNKNTNISKTNMIMKKNIMKAILAMVAMVATFALTSCSKDNDDNKTSVVTEIKAQPYFYVAPEMLNLFDITLSVNGKTIEITKDNTVSCQVVENKGSQIEMTLDLLKYTLPTCTVSATTQTFVTTIKVKDGINIAEQPSSNYFTGFDICSEGSTTPLKHAIYGGKNVRWADVAKSNRLDNYIGTFNWNVQLVDSKLSLSRTK